MTEIEIKLRMPDAAAARAGLLKLGAKVHRERARETNTLYDFPSRELARGQRALRLRTFGRTATLTFKGSPLPSRRFKVREEFETVVRSVKQAERILRAVGFVPVFRYEKFRTVFLRDRVKVSLDETSLGVFLELEGERSRIVRLVKLLGQDTTAMIKLDYVEMYRQAGQGPA